MKALSFLCIFICNHLYGAMYFYHPHSRMYLGGGYNPYKPESGYLQCIEYDEITSVNSPAAISSHVEMSHIQNMEELHSKIQFSSFLEGSYLFTKGKVSLNFDSSHIFSSDSLSWVIVFQTNYGMFTLKNPRLKSSFSNLTDLELIETCGTEIISEEKRSILLYAVLTIHNLSSSQRKQFKNQFSVDSSFSGFNISFQSKFDSFLQAATAMNHLSLKIFTLGGRGIVDMADLLNYESHLEYKQVIKNMHQYLQNVDQKYAVPTAFISTDLHAFYPSLKHKTPLFKKEVLTKLYHRYEELQTKRKKIKNLFDNPQIDVSTNNNPTVLQNHLSFYEQALNKVHNHANKCFDQHKQLECFVPHIEEPFIEWSKYKKSNSRCEQLRKIVLNKKIISEEFYQMASRRDFIPVLGPNDSSIEEWIPCNS